jgi:hypothetical protein
MEELLKVGYDAGLDISSTIAVRILLSTVGLRQRRKMSMERFG